MYLFSLEDTKFDKTAEEGIRCVRVYGQPIVKDI